MEVFLLLTKCGAKFGQGHVIPQFIVCGSDFTSERRPWGLQACQPGGAMTLSPKVSQHGVQRPDTTLGPLEASPPSANQCYVSILFMHHFRLPLAMFPSALRRISWATR